MVQNKVAYFLMAQVYNDNSCQ